MEHSRVWRFLIYRYKINKPFIIDVITIIAIIGQWKAETIEH